MKTVCEEGTLSSKNLICTNSAELLTNFTNLLNKQIIEIDETIFQSYIDYQKELNLYQLQYIKQRVSAADLIDNNANIWRTLMVLLRIINYCLSVSTLQSHATTNMRRFG